MRLSQGQPFAALSWFAVGFALLTSCGGHEGRIDDDESGGSSQNAEGGRSAAAGTQDEGPVAGTEAQAGAPGEETGAGGAGSDSDPSGGSPEEGEMGGAGGVSDTPNGGTTQVLTTRCVYHTEAPEPEEEVSGEGGAGPAPTVTVLKNAFAGQYLADERGMALYIYGGDYPGDCEHAPISNCANDCVVAWPLFDAGARVLPDTLDDSLFGTLDRGDGSTQTTYRGWPLYYYKKDLQPADVLGHGKGVWYLATVALPNIVVVNLAINNETKRVLADEDGHTLYTFADDTQGTGSTDPLSACTGECSKSFPPFIVKRFAPVSILDPANFRFFVRPDGTQQIAYKGAPLYLSALDARSGEQAGSATAGFGAAVQ